LFVKKYLQTTTLDSLIESVAVKIIEYGKLANVPGIPLQYCWQYTKFIGAAHGVAGILYILLDVPLIREKYKQVIIDSITWLISLKRSNGNYPTASDMKDDHLVHWCHGAPAMALLFTKAYKIYKIDNFLIEAEAAAEFTWKYGLLKKGFSICHGVTGNAYVFLHLYAVTKNPKHLWRAIKFGEYGITRIKNWIQTTDEPYSLFEGIAGATLFYNDLIHNNDQPCFPCFDV